MKFVIAMCMTTFALTLNAVAAAPRLTLSCDSENDLYLALKSTDAEVVRYDSPAEAIEHAETGDAVLILADAYPELPTDFDARLFKIAQEKELRVYVEYVDELPGLSFEPPQTVTWERLVVADPSLGKPLPPMRLLMAQECRFLPVQGVDSPLIVLARVAGYDTAIFGLPEQSFPILFRVPQSEVWVATTKLSHFITGRYAPTAQWAALWEHIIAQLAPDASPIKLKWEPIVGPSMHRGDEVSPQAERDALNRAGDWLLSSRLLIGDQQVEAVHDRLRRGVNTHAAPPAAAAIGDGSNGILEGYSSGIQFSGAQLQLQPIRFDCQTESAMVLALDGEASHRAIAENLLDFAYFKSDMLANNERGDPSHPSYGLLAWGSIAPAWLVGNYGDDNARALLATIVAAAALKTDRYDQAILTAIYANLRTTGKLGFRGDRVDQPQLEQLGWKHFHGAETVNLSPHFESGLWACYLWAYHQTGDAELLDRTKVAIRMTMDAYDRKDWRWNSNLERSRMLLPLAWLVRVDDTPEHRQWLRRVASDLVAAQVQCGAIREGLNQNRGGHFSVPQSNEAYGVGETPMAQNPDDPVSDQLYTTGFALLALREASAATGDAFYGEAENKLAAYLCRIQTRSVKRPELDGWWFRAFDYEKWETWASSADIGWGAWSLEAGWAQTWTAATLALRSRQTSVWAMTESSTIETKLPMVRAELAKNSGGPLRP